MQFYSITIENCCASEPEDGEKSQHNEIFEDFNDAIAKVHQMINKDAETKVIRGEHRDNEYCEIAELSGEEYDDMIEKNKKKNTRYVCRDDNMGDDEKCTKQIFAGDFHGVLFTIQPVKLVRKGCLITASSD